MAIKKMRAKSRKGVVKRVKITNGGDIHTGKLMVNRINDNHRLIKKSRTRKLKAKKSTVLKKVMNKLRRVM
jgi:ribosomal protein L35